MGPPEDRGRFSVFRRMNMNKDIRTCKHLPELDGSQLYSFRDYLRGNSFYTRFLNASKPLRCAKCHKKLLPPRVYEITENVCAFLFLPLLFLWKEVIRQTIGYVQGILGFCFIFLMLAIIPVVLYFSVEFSLRKGKWREIEAGKSDEVYKGILINRAHDIRVWNVLARIAGGAVALLVLLLYKTGDGSLSLI